MSDTANSRQDYLSPKDGIDLAKASPHPDLSAKHADWAVDHLVKSNSTTDSRERELEVRLAQAYATLSLRDKLDELNATIKLAVSQVLGSQATLNENVKQAAQHLHRDAQELKRHLRVIEGEAA